MRNIIVLAFLILLSGCHEKEGEVIQYCDIPTVGNSGESDLLNTRDDRLYLSWIEQSSEKNSVLRLSEYIDNEWQDAQTIAEGDEWFVNWADFPALEDWGPDGLVSHFLEKSAPDTYAYDVKVTLSSDGGRTWNAAFSPHTDSTATEHGFVSKLALNDKEFLLAWLDGRQYAYAKADSTLTEEMTLRAAVMDKQGHIIKEYLIDDRVCDCCQTAMAMSAEGPVIVYRDRSDGEIRDIYYSRLVNDSWTAPKAIYDDNWMIPGCPVNGPAIVARDKNVAVAWFAVKGEFPEVKLSFSSDSGISFGSPYLLNLVQPLGRVDLVWLDDERVLVSWMDANAEGNTQINLQSVSKTGQLGKVINVTATSPERSTGFPRMAMHNNEIFITWTDTQEESRVQVAKIPVDLLY